VSPVSVILCQHRLTVNRKFSSNEFAPKTLEGWTATILKTVPLKVKGARNDADMKREIIAAITTASRDHNVKDNFNCFDYTNWAAEQLREKRYITLEGFNTIHNYYEAEKAGVRTKTQPIIDAICQRVAQKASGSGRK
jgi:hypothetical protein